MDLCRIARWTMLGTSLVLLATTAVSADETQNSADMDSQLIVDNQSQGLSSLFGLLVMSFGITGLVLTVKKQNEDK